MTLNRLLRILRRLALAAGLTAGALTAVTPAHAITTPEILTKTITSMPSCMKYQVKGMCFFLKCGWTGCRIRTSLRIAHYVPDAIVSTYNDPLAHPWVEVGKPIATVMSAVGGAMIAGGPGLLDASANTAPRAAQTTTTFKTVDAIGNPAGMIMQVFLTQQLPSLPENFAVPGTTELMKFPGQELPRITALWSAVPSELLNNLSEAALATVKAPLALVNRIMAVPGYIGQLQSAAGNVGQVMNAGVEIGEIAGMASQIAGIDLGPLNSVVQLAGMAAGGSPFGQLFCPGAATPFSLHFQSDLDSLFWRDMIPVELLYPQAWIPTMDEVSQSPLINTWGAIYPRTGFGVQQHGVKASAVYAERVGAIIRKTAQPHIYAPLVPGGGFRYFNTMTRTRWQMLAPSSTGCIEFGQNDSLSLTSFGDFKTSANDGYTWNMWNWYDCCQKRGSFLFSIP